MKKVYTQLSIKVITVTYAGALCASVNIESKPKLKKYGCPIKKGLDCLDYDKQMNEWAAAIECLAKNRINRPIYTSSDECYCPHKGTCPIYKERVSQKTR
ncbi:MAG: hypothetical protein ACLRFJ_01475 [Alphaproteobacteria bacterium]